MLFDSPSFNLKNVINASGKMTILGVSTVSEAVLQAQRYGSEHFFVMEELIEEAGKYLGDLLDVEDVQIVSSASAGIAQSVAALIGRGSSYHLYHPYSDKVKRREIILPKGHNVDYGTPVELMVQQGGGIVVEAGYANMCSPEHVSQLINEQTAAVLYIKSHHTVQKSMLSVKEAAEIAHSYELPLIVDAAAEEDVFSYVNAGADLVVYSGAKAFEGPSSGMVIGKKQYIGWVRLQSKGIGRSMKIGKENILGLMQAVEDFIKLGKESGESMKMRLTPFIQRINQINHLEAEIVQDSAGRDIYRAKVKTTGDISAQRIVDELKQLDRAVYTREYQVNQNIIEFDVRAVTDEQLIYIADGLSNIMEKSVE